MQVNYRGPGVILNFPTGFFDTTAPFLIFPIHEKVFVQAANFSNNVLPNHHEAASNDVHIRGFGKLSSPITRKVQAFSKKRAEWQETNKQKLKEIREPVTTSLKAPIWKLNPASHDPHVWLLFHIMHAVSQGVGQDDGIVVE
jgi:hypothetical protein